MSRLEYIDPLVGGTCATAKRAALDSRVIVDVDGSDRFHYHVTDGDDHLFVRVGFDATDTASITYVLAEVPGPGTITSPAIVQRFNRLFRDLPGELLWYHRTGKVQYHLPGQWLDLPVTVKYEGGRVSYRQGAGDWVAVSPVAVRPVRAPHAPKPVAAPVAAPGPAVAPTATPQPVARPEASSPPPSAHGDTRGLFKFPVVTKRSEVIVKADVATGLDGLWALHLQGHRQVVAIVGPTGTGKTSLAYNLAARHSVGIMTFDSAGAREFSDWVGTTHLRDGETKFIPSGFLSAIDADGPYGGQPRIILIDEVNRAESSGALNALVPVLHGFGTLYVPELGRGVNIDPTAMVILTANRGMQYAVVALDLALSDRVTAWVKMEYIEPDREKALIVERYSLLEEDASRLVAAAQRVRDAANRGELPEGGGVSTRRLMQAAEKVEGGFTLLAAASWTWTGAYSDEGGSNSESTIVQAAIDAVLRGF